MHIEKLGLGRGHFSVDILTSHFNGNKNLSNTYIKPYCKKISSPLFDSILEILLFQTLVETINNNLKISVRNDDGLTWSG